MNHRTYTWSPILSLHEYLQAPKQAGIYEIGFKRPGYTAAQQGNLAAC